MIARGHNGVNGGGGGGAWLQPMSLPCNNPAPTAFLSPPSLIPPLHVGAVMSSRYPDCGSGYGNGSEFVYHMCGYGG